MPETAKTIIEGGNLPEAKGPYSLAVRAGGFLFVSGLGPVKPGTGEAVRDDFEGAVRLTMANLQAVLEAAGTSLAAVVKTSVFLADIERFAEFNRIYGEYFAADPPARTTVQPARLPLDIPVEIDAIAYAPTSGEGQP